MKRLKQSELAEWRHEQSAAQENKCPLCGEFIPFEQLAADHNHKTGKMRCVLHRGCNAMLGRIENNYRRHCIKDLPFFLHKAAEYLLQADKEVYHPSYRTEEEKRVRRNKRAKKARNLKKSKSTK